MAFRCYTTDEFIARAIEVHGDKYDYSLVEYERNNKKVTIICKTHGPFMQMARQHLKKQGCRHCGHEKNKGWKDNRRIKAKRLGYKTYVGNPCSHGHTLRYISNNSCYNCSAQQRKKWREENKDIHKEMTDNWRRNNPEKYAESNYARSVTRNRRSKHANVFSDNKDVRESLRAIYLECKRLRAQTGKDVHVDHIIPLGAKNVCGLHVPWNLQIASAEYNCKKNNSIDHVYSYYDWRNNVMMHESALPWNLKEAKDVN